MTGAANKGIIDRPSNQSVDRTEDRLKNVLRSKGLTLFAWSTTAEKPKEWD